MDDHATTDARVETVTYCPAKRRHGLSLELFDRYWKDVHGPTCARVGITWQYTQFHLGHDEGGIWRVPAGVDQSTPPAEQIDGIAELTYLTHADYVAWMAAAGVLERDEQNVFGETTPYLVTEGRARTYTDRIPNRTPNGDLGVERYHLLLKKQCDVPLEELRGYLLETFAPNVAADPRVLKLRLHLFDPYGQEWESVNVDHALDAGRIAHAPVEIAFASRLHLAEFQRSETYALAVADQAAFVRQISVFPEREAYAMIQEGRPTLMGLRSPSVARTITEAGAATNLDPEIVELFGGRAPGLLPDVAR